MPKPDLRSMNLDEILEITRQMQLPDYRAKQIFQRIIGGAQSFDEMTDLSKKFAAGACR